MAAADRAYFSVREKTPPEVYNAFQYGGAGWIGSKQGKRNEFVTIDSNGYSDAARAAGGALGATVDVALLHSDVASTVAADSDDAKKVEIRKLNERTIIELPMVNNSDTYVTVLNTRAGETLGLYRRTDGSWAADANGSSHFYVTGVDVAKGTVKGIIVEANRLK